MTADEPLRAHVGRNLGLTPERAVRLLRAKAAELEAKVKLLLGDDSGPMIGLLATDIAFVAGLLADHIERMERLDAEKLAMIAEVKGMAT